MRRQVQKDDLYYRLIYDYYDDYYLIYDLYYTENGRLNVEKSNSISKSVSN